MPLTLGKHAGYTKKIKEIVDILRPLSHLWQIRLRRRGVDYNLRATKIGKNQLVRGLIKYIGIAMGVHGMEKPDELF